MTSLLKLRFNDGRTAFIRAKCSERLGQSSALVLCMLPFIIIVCSEKKKCHLNKCSSDWWALVLSVVWMFPLLFKWRPWNVSTPYFWNLTHDHIGGLKVFMKTRRPWIVCSKWQSYRSWRCPAHCSLPLISSGHAETILGSPAGFVILSTSILEQRGEQPMGMSCLAHILLHHSASED